MTVSRPRWGALLAVPVAVMVVATAGGAQEARLRTEVDTAQITVGGRIQLTIGVGHAPGQRVAFPDSLDLAPFEVLGIEVFEPAALDETVTSAATYTLTAFELGELEIPSFEVALLDTGGGTAILDTHPYGVVVSSVGLDESGDIRDVKAPLEIALSGLVLAAWLLAFLALLGLLYWLYRRHRRQPASGPITVAAPLRRPYEAAYDALRELEAEGLLDRGEVKEHYVGVSEIIRAYVEAQYGVQALEMASYEVLDGLERIGVDQETWHAFEGFLAECDLVKFAKFTPDLPRCREIVPRARRLVDRTKVGRPAPHPEPVGEVVP